MNNSKKTNLIFLKLTDEEKAIIEQAAYCKGQDISSYIVSTIIKQGLGDIEQNETIHLENEARDYLMEILDNPPEPNEALIELMSGI